MRPSRAARPSPLHLRGTELAWGVRTYVMGIVNVTPDSFSGDGLLDPGSEGAAGERSAEARAVALAVRMVKAGADILDIGGESTRPGHEPVDEDEESHRVVGVVAAIRARLPDAVLSIDTTKPGVARAALDAGADIVNDVAATLGDGAMARLVADRRVPYVLGHARPEPRYRSVVADVVADLRTAIERAVATGCARELLVVDPGIGFAKAPGDNLALLRELPAIGALGQPVLVGFSRKSTIGRVLDLPPHERLEGTLVTTALAVAGGADIVRVHDVLANVRAARMADAVVRGWPVDGI